MPLALDPPPQRSGDAKAEARRRDEEIGAHRHGTLGGGGRRRRTEVRDEIDDGPVGLVADRGDERDGACGSGAGDALVVEAPEIFEAAPAASDDDEIGPRHGPQTVAPVEAADGPGNLE